MKFSGEQVRFLTGDRDLSAASVLTEEERKRCLVISDVSYPDMPIVLMSDQFEEHTGYEESEVIGRNCRFLQGPETDPKTVQTIREAIAAEREITADILNYKKDGTKFRNCLRIRPMKNVKGKARYFVGFQNPIAEENVCSEPVNDFVDRQGLAALRSVTHHGAGYSLRRRLIVIESPCVLDKYQ
jgi:PAS domain S-box-containing protein